jgi:protein TonB
MAAERSSLFGVYLCMASELFRSELPGTPAARRALVLPFSITAHVAVLAAIFTAPLLGDIEFPPPNRPLNYAYTNIELPPPPSVALKPLPSTKTSTASADNAPLVAPTEIKPETALEFTSGSSDGPGDDDGVPFGIDGALGPPVPALPPPPPVEPRKPVRPGGNIQPPRRIVNVAPVYPGIAQSARVEGTVEIEALIGEDGKVRNVKLLSGRPLLTEAALTAVRQWVFTPTRLNGEPVAVIMTVTVVFSLQ